MDEAALLAGVRANKKDDSARLVYADWLEERGDPRGELLRVESALFAILKRKKRDREHVPLVRDGHGRLSATYVALWPIASMEWLRAVDRVSARLLPETVDWDKYDRARSYQHQALRADMFCFLLIGLLGKPRVVVPGAEASLAAAQRRVLTFYTRRDGFGSGSVSVELATTEEIQNEARNCDALEFPCEMTEQMLECLRWNGWETFSDAPFGNAHVPITV
jgi:uncharacterized protein (TIGR02996 family)